MAAGEAGGITQGIGAYKVEVPVDGKQQTCVFLDTPGHEVNNVLVYRCSSFTCYMYSCAILSIHPLILRVLKKYVLNLISFNVPL